MAERTGAVWWPGPGAGQRPGWPLRITFITLLMVRRPAAVSDLQTSLESSAVLLSAVLGIQTAGAPDRCQASKNCTLHLPKFGGKKNKNI